MPSPKDVVRLRHMLDHAREAISKEDRERYSNIPWPEIIGLRNRLIHGYDEIDFDILWQIVSADLPPLIENLVKHLEGRK